MFGKGERMFGDDNQAAPADNNDNNQPMDGDNNDQGNHDEGMSMPAPSDDQNQDAPSDDTPAPQPDDVIPNDHAAHDDLLNLKQQALQQLSPLVGHLDQTPEEKFRTTMMMIQASDNAELLKQAYDAAQAIPDEKTKAQALLDVINEINYFTQAAGQDEHDTAQPGA